MILFVLLAGFIAAGLAALPHVLWSKEQKKISWFKSGWDEDTYAERAIRSEMRPDRMLSTLMVKGLLVAFDGDTEDAMIAMDVLFAFTTAALAALFTVYLTELWMYRCALWLLFLFGQELFSTGSSAVWPSSFAIWNWFDFSTWKQLVPLASTSFFSLFRSPEPQVAWSVFFATMICWIRYLLPSLGRWNYRQVLLCILLSCLSVTVYAFVGLPLWLGQVALAAFCFRAGKKFELKVLAASLLTALPVFMLLSSHEAKLSSTGTTFTSHLPSFAVSTVFALALLSILISRRRQTDFSKPAVWIGALFLASPLVMMNQQLLTGRMISTRDFEVNINFILLATGAALIWMPERAGLSRPVRCGVWLFSIVALLLIIGGQFKVFKYWRNHNEVAARFTELALAAESREILIADRFDVASLTRVKLENGMRPQKTAFLGYFNDVQDRHISNLENPRDVPLGREQHEASFFDFLYRTGVSSENFEKRLCDELAERESLFYAAFFFSIGDVWFPHTDRRADRRDWAVQQIPLLVSEYRNYRARTDEPGFRENLSKPVSILSTVPLEPEPTHSLFVTVETARTPLKSQAGFAYLYRQTLK